MVLIPDDAASDLSDEENTTVGNSGDIFHDQEGDSPKRPYKPKNEFLLCSKEKLEERIRGAECEKKQIAPQQLSTTATAERLELMRSRDLIDSIVTRFRIRNPQVRRVRSSNVTYYNWLLLDLARRVAVVERRLQNEFPHTWEEELRHQVIDPAAGRVWWSIKFTKSFAKISEDNEYFDFFPPFVAKKRQQMLETARIFGDEICAFVEFIDMHKIANLPREDFHVFLKELSLVKDKLEDSINILKPLFKNDPIHPYETLTPLN